MKLFILSKKFNVKFKRDPITFWIEKINSMPYEMTSSMYLDFKSKKRLELEWLSGSILNLGKSVDLNSNISHEIVSGNKS